MAADFLTLSRETGEYLTKHFLSFLSNSLVLDFGCTIYVAVFRHFVSKKGTHIGSPSLYETEGGVSFILDGLIHLSLLAFRLPVLK